METIKVENVKEAIEALYISREYAKNNNIWTPDFIFGQVKAYDFCIGVLENLIVRRQRNELGQTIEHGKEHRKQYRGSKAIDYSCRNNGGCLYCEGNRLHKFKQNSRQLTMAELDDDEDDDEEQR